MINLIPNEEKKKKVQDFYFRAMVVCFFVLGSSVLIASVALLPAYFLSFIRSGLVKEKLQTQTSEVLPEVDQETDKLAKDLNLKLETIEKVQNKSYSISEKIIAPIIKDKMDSIKITRIYSQNNGKGVVASITGTATSREELLLFRKALEANPAFKKVDLPVSNFVQGSNIKFFLNLIPADAN